MTVYLACEQAPALRTVFLDGEVKFCQVLVLAAVVRRQGHGWPADGAEDGCGAGGAGGGDGRTAATPAAPATNLRLAVPRRPGTRPCWRGIARKDVRRWRRCEGSFYRACSFDRDRRSGILESRPTQEEVPSKQARPPGRGRARAPAPARWVTKPWILLSAVSPSRHRPRWPCSGSMPSRWLDECWATMLRGMPVWKRS